MGADEEDEVESKTKSFKCKYCDKEFTIPQALGGHQNIHREEREAAELQKLERELFPRGLPALHPFVRDISTPQPHPLLAVMAAARPASFHGGGHESIQGGLIPRDRPWGGPQFGHNQSMQRLPQFNSQSIVPHGLPDSAYGPCPPRSNHQHPGQFHDFPPQQFPSQQFSFQPYAAGLHIDPSFQGSPLPTVGSHPPAHNGSPPPHAGLPFSTLQFSQGHQHEGQFRMQPQTPLQSEPATWGLPAKNNCEVLNEGGPLSWPHQPYADMGGSPDLKSLQFPPDGHHQVLHARDNDPGMMLGGLGGGRPPHWMPLGQPPLQMQMSHSQPSSHRPALFHDIFTLPSPRQRDPLHPQDPEEQRHDNRQTGLHDAPTSHLQSQPNSDQFQEDIGVVQERPTDQHQLSAYESDPLPYDIHLDNEWISRPDQVPPSHEDDEDLDWCSFLELLSPTHEHDAQASLASASNRVAGNPDYFYDFSADRAEVHVMKDQVWAAYDTFADPDADGMPRLYCLVTEVTQAPFYMEGVILQPIIDEKAATFDWLFDRDITSLGIGGFMLSDEKLKSDTTDNLLSHLMDTKENKHAFEIFPKTPEVWAIYADYGKDVSCKDVNDKWKFRYEFVLIKDRSPASIEEGWDVVALQKLEGHKTLWEPHGQPYLLTVKDGLKLFSHRVPAVTAKDVPGVPSECLVLDPACACDLSIDPAPACA